MPKLELLLEGENLASLVPTLKWEGTDVSGQPINLQIEERDAADLNWLQEDPMVGLYSLGSGRRGRAEEAIQRIGETLYSSVSSTEELRSLLSQALSPGQAATLVISSNSAEALLLPWELMRSPDRSFLSDRLQGLARLYSNLNVPAVSPPTSSDRPRILLCITRPKAEEDVEYRAIAAKLLDRMQTRAEVRVVRPGTFRALERALSEDRYDLVHYDGHGDHGLLSFEDQDVESQRLGAVLAQSGVPLFALNACRSAVGTDGQDEAARLDSVAHSLLSSGARGVLAMGANVRVSAAVEYFDRFYAELIGGESLTGACHRARRALETGQGFGPVDWAIPVLYLRDDFQPFPTGTAQGTDILEMLKGETPPAEVKLRPSDVFIGREGDLYKVDRAVDENHRVLVYGVGGIGKTTLLEHVLNWRARTGGADRLLSFSFRDAPSLEKLAQEMQGALVEVHPEISVFVQKAEWVNQEVKDKLTRLAQIIASGKGGQWLVLFDNLETLGGYPIAGEGPYTDEERATFLALLASLEGEGSRVVMTSRRDEVTWLSGQTCRFRLRGVGAAYQLEMLQAYAKDFDAEARLKAAVDSSETELGELLQMLGGHPLATRAAAYGLKDRPVSEVLQSIQGQVGRIEVPVLEQSTRSGSLEAVIAGMVGHIPENRRRSLGLVGLFRGAFHQNRLTEMVAMEDFPEGILADRSSESVEGGLQEAARLGLMQPDASMTGVWRVVPGAQGALDRIWREELSEEQITAVEEHFLAYWAGQGAAYHSALSSKGQAQQAVGFAITEEGNLRRALDLAAKRHSWSPAADILPLLLEVFSMIGRIKDVDHLRQVWLEKVSRAGEPIDPSHEDLVGLWRFLMGDLANRLLGAGALEKAEQIYQQIVIQLEKDPRLHAPNLAAGYHQLGRVEEDRGQLDEAETWYRKSLEIKEELGNCPSMATT